MTSKLEEIARALCKKRGEIPDRRIQEYGRTSYSYPAWEDFREDAVAALEAMKNPTEEMIDEGRRKFWCDPEETELDEGVKDAFNAMIDAALEEK